MSEDLIKRSDAIEAIELVDWYHQNRNKDIVSGANSREHQAWYKAEDIYEALEAVPAAKPKRGKWIWDKDAIDWNIGAWVCSNCHARNDNIPYSEIIIPLRWSGSNFCPNCGADMRGENNERRFNKAE